MTDPAQRKKKQSYMVTVSAVAGRAVLRPDAEATEIFETALGYALSKTSVELHSACANTNHYHLVVTDVEAELGRFMGLLNQILATELNRHHGLTGPVFVRYHWEALDEAFELYNAMTYTLTNPVKDGLARTYDSWCGHVTKIGELGGAARTVTRGRSGHNWSKRSKLERSYEIPVTIPELLLAEDSPADVRARLGKMVQQSTRKWRSVHKDRPVMPKGKLRKLPPSVPRARPKRYRGLDVGRRRKRLSFLRRRRLLERRDFVEKHRDAMTAWRERNREVVFPYGTYKMRRLHGVREADPPPPPS